MVFYTMGVYGLSEDEFFDKLLSNKIDTFIDIRRRRAVRGSEYTFVNSKKLQSKLAGLEIQYIHVPELSPTNEIKNLQYAEDERLATSQRSRQQLSNVFITAYKNQILNKYSLDNLMDQLRTSGTQRALLFCVERNAAACHRSVVAKKINHDYEMSIIHL